MISVTTKLSVKELAGPLGVSVGFVYKMRMAGFPMERDEASRCFVATPGAARRWIRENRFKIVNGRPVKISTNGVKL